jgi:BioD-like phosphotransacetylase family protein
MPEHEAMTRAVDRGVPLLLTPFDTIETVRRIEEARGPIRLTSPRQIERLSQVIRREFDFDALFGALGIPLSPFPKTKGERSRPEDG